MHMIHYDIIIIITCRYYSDSPGQSGPSDVLSLTKLKTLPLERQVTEFMKKGACTCISLIIHF